MTQEELEEMYFFMIGKGIQRAARMISSSMHVRVIKKDGKNVPVDATYKENRLNVETENKIVTRILSIG